MREEKEPLEEKQAAAGAHAELMVALSPSLLFDPRATQHEYDEDDDGGDDQALATAREEKSGSRVVFPTAVTPSLSLSKQSDFDRMVMTMEAVSDCSETRVLSALEDAVKVKEEARSLLQQGNAFKDQVCTAPPFSSSTLKPIHFCSHSFINLSIHPLSR